METIRLIKPYIAFNEVEDDFRAVFENGIFTRGEHVAAFAEEISVYTGAKHAFLTSSATTALWVCLKALGIGPGDEVAVSDFSFPATANVVEDLGARPVFVDVAAETYNMRTDDLEAKITHRTKAVLFVDALGNPSGIHAIKAVCEAHGLPLIEDAACAIGSSENDRRCGSIADLTCFSFHPRKLLSTGEGGAITTDREDWAEWLRVKLLHGGNGMNGIGMDFVDYGYNFRMSELQAIMGRKQLTNIEDIVDERNATRDEFIELLSPMGFVPQSIGPGVRYNVQSLVFRTPEKIDRNRLVGALRTAGVETTLGTYCQSGTKYYRNKYNDVQPVSEALEAMTLTLPCYRDVPVHSVVEQIKWLL